VITMANMRYAESRLWQEPEQHPISEQMKNDFTPIDLTPPSISYTAIPTQLSLSAPALSATITDASGVNVTAGTKPRIYYKRSQDANAYNDNTSSTDGWKWVEASNASSPFSFTLDYSKIYGGSVAGRDVIQYFVVAQDEGASVPPTPNVGVNAGTFASTPDDVALVTAELPTGFNSYLINVLSGTVTVGNSGADYPSLTNNGGVFQAINTGVLSGNLTIEVISDLTTNENGLHGLNQWTEIGGSGYKVQLVPDGSTNRTISATYAGTAVSRCRT
jgi:hypothetical protein